MTNKEQQKKVYDKWHAGWNTLSFEEQFRYHLKSAGHVLPVKRRVAGQYISGGLEFCVEEIDMPEAPTPTPFVKKSQLALIGEAIVKTMHDKDTTASKKSSVLSLLVGKVPDHLASKATATGKQRLQTLKTQGPVKKRILKKDKKRRIRSITDKQIIDSLADDTSDSCRFTSDGTQLGTVSNNL